MEKEGGIALNQDVQVLNGNSFAVQEVLPIETSFVYDEIKVRLTFADNEKQLDDLLINYFINLKQGGY